MKINYKIMREIYTKNFKLQKYQIIVRKSKLSEKRMKSSEERMKSSEKC